MSVHAPSFVRKLLLGSALLCLIACTCGCPKSKPTENASGSAAKVAATQAANGSGKNSTTQPISSTPTAGFESLPEPESKQVTLIEIRETNRDTLPEMETDHQEGSGALRWLDGKLYLDSRTQPGHEDRVDEDEIDIFATVPPLNVDSDIPAKDCQLFVHYIVQYQGRGRQGTVEKWFAFQGLDGQWSERFIKDADPLQHDPAGDEPAFEFWLEKIRCGPNDEVSIQVLGGDQASIRFGNQQHKLTRGQSVELSEQSLEIAIEQLPLTGAAFGDRSNFEPDQVVVPGNRFGPIQFSTRVEAELIGSVPLVLE